MDCCVSVDLSIYFVAWYSMALSIEAGERRVGEDLWKRYLYLEREERIHALYC